MKTKKIKTVLPLLLIITIAFSALSGCKDKNANNYQNNNSQTLQKVEERKKLEEQQRQEEQKKLENQKKEAEFQAERQAAVAAINNNNNTIKNNKQKISSYENEILNIELRQISIRSELSTCERTLNNAYAQLENARSQKVRVYRAGIGWVYQADENAIANARNYVEQYQNQYAQLQETQNSFYRQASKLQNDIERLKNENLSLEAKNNELKNKYKIN